MKRVKKQAKQVNVEKMNVEQIQVLTEDLSKQVNLIVDTAIAKANMLLGIYGLETKMQIVIQKRETTI